MQHFEAALKGMTWTDQKHSHFDRPPNYEALKHICLVCRKRSPDSCSKCKKAFYCCREHQSEHWDVHRPECDRLCKLAAADKSQENMSRMMAGPGDGGGEEVRRRQEQERAQAEIQLERARNPKKKDLYVGPFSEKLSHKSGR